MAYTRHGHHIPGTNKGEGSIRAMTPPKRCGGVYTCSLCKQEHLRAHEEGKVTRIVSEGIHNPGTDMVPEHFPEKARRLVREHILSHYAAAEDRPAFEEYVVTFTYILGGWKAMVATDMSDGKYFEVTYNFAKQETYIDEYVKVVNVTIQD